MAIVPGEGFLLLLSRLCFVGKPEASLYKSNVDGGYACLANKRSVFGSCLVILFNQFKLVISSLYIQGKSRLSQESFPFASNLLFSEIMGEESERVLGSIKESQFRLPAILSKVWMEMGSLSVQNACNNAVNLLALPFFSANEFVVVLHSSPSKVWI